MQFLLKPCYSKSVAALKTYKVFKIPLNTGFKNTHGMLYFPE